MVDYDAALATINLMGECANQPPDARVIAEHELQGMYSNIIVSISTSSASENPEPSLDYEKAFNVSLGLSTWMSASNQWREVTAKIQVEEHDIGSIQLRSRPGEVQSA